MRHWNQTGNSPPLPHTLPLLHSNEDKLEEEEDCPWNRWVSFLAESLARMSGSCTWMSHILASTLGEAIGWAELGCNSIIPKFHYWFYHLLTYVQVERLTNIVWLQKGVWKWPPLPISWLWTGPICEWHSQLSFDHAKCIVPLYGGFLPSMSMVCRFCLPMIMAVSFTQWFWWHLQSHWIQ